jgi:GTP-binding protein HflX
MEELKEKAILVGVILTNNDYQTIEELSELAKTAKAEPVGGLTQKKDQNR